MTDSRNNKHVPKYVYLMLAVTFLYLTIEIPFSLHLIKFMGGNPSASDIDDIEVIGRLLTGVAVAIFMMGIMLPKMASKGKTSSTFLVLVAVGASIGGTFALLNYIAEMTGSSSTASERQDAFVTNILKREVAEKGVGSINNTNDTDWLVFVSVVPSLVQNSNALKELVLTDEPALFANEAQRSLGSLKAARHLFFNELDEVAKVSYIEYEKGMVEYRDAIFKVEAEMNKAWSRFQDESYKRIGYTNNKSMYAPQARQELRKQGLYFSKNQDPYNRHTFDVVFLNKYAKPARDAFASETKKHFGVSVDPYYNLYGFLESNGFQQKLRDQFKIVGDVHINSNMSDENFAAYVHKPLIAYNEKMYASAFNAPVDKFADGQEYAGLGVNAIKMISIPVMAILLSMAGALLHIHKFSAYFIQAVNSKAKIRFLNNSLARHLVVATAIGLAIISTVYTSENIITRNDTYVEMSGSPISSKALAAIISVQPYFTKIGEVLSMFGAWSLVEQHLPAITLFQPNEIIEITVADDTSEPAINIPIPLPRPN